MRVRGRDSYWREDVEEERSEWMEGKGGRERRVSE